jgi:hypothetical protein
MEKGMTPRKGRLLWYIRQGPLPHFASVMQFAVNETGTRLEPTPKGKGLCPACGAPVIAKCGEILTWHWSHLTKDCDPWYEPESAWHRQWKEKFPSEWREVVVGRHRADVKTPIGIIEFQASCISPGEIQERENFYQTMAWVIKADAFDLEPILSPHARCRYHANRLPMPIEPHNPNLFDLLGPHSSETEKEQEQRKDRQMAWQKYKQLAEERRDFNAKIWGESWEFDPMYKWKWPRKSWLFARKKIYMDRGFDLFRVDWISEDGRIIKGRHCDKEWFIRTALQARCRVQPAL